MAKDKYAQPTLFDAEAAERAVVLLERRKMRMFEPLSETFQVVLTDCFHALTELGHTESDIRKMLSLTFLEWKDSRRQQPRR